MSGILRHKKKLTALGDYIALFGVAVGFNPTLMFVFAVVLALIAVCVEKLNKRVCGKMIAQQQPFQTRSEVRNVDYLW